MVALHEAHCWLDLGQLPRAREQLQACGDVLPGHFEARRQLLWARLQVRLGQDPTPHLEAAAAAAPVRGWPEVLSATLERDRLQVTTRQAEALLTRLLREDPGFGDIEVKRAGLAEAFNELTNEKAEVLP